MHPFSISIHALLAESDSWIRFLTRMTRIFLSTLSLRRATLTEINKMATGQISIHALLAESDTAFQKLMAALLQFLSTLSLRRATPRRGGQASASANFYPRSPCGERLILHMAHLMELLFLSTLSLRRATSITTITIFIVLIFLSTLSLRRATTKRQQLRGCRQISIHALLAESDELPQNHRTAIRYFYPRSPCGERQHFVKTLCRFQKFLSTLSLRRATNAFAL